MRTLVFLAVPWLASADKSCGNDVFTDEATLLQGKLLSREKGTVAEVEEVESETTAEDSVTRRHDSEEYSEVDSNVGSESSRRRTFGGRRRVSTPSDSGRWTMDGCERGGDDNHPLTHHTNPHYRARVSCCTDAREQRRRCQTRFANRGLEASGGCYGDVTYGEAVAICESDQKRLCYTHEIDDQVCCGTGCGINFNDVWVNNPTPPPPPLPPALPSHTSLKDACYNKCLFEDGWWEWDPQYRNCPKCKRYPTEDKCGYGWYTACSGECLPGGGLWEWDPHYRRNGRRYTTKESCLVALYHARGGGTGNPSSSSSWTIDVSGWTVDHPWTIDASGWTIDGCPEPDDRQVGEHPLTFHEASEGHLAGVRCCSTTGEPTDDGFCQSRWLPGGVDFTSPDPRFADTPHPGCYFDVKNDEAVAICASVEKRLCTVHEIPSCCDSGCYHNLNAVWVTNN